MNEMLGQTVYLSVYLPTRLPVCLRTHCALPEFFEMLGQTLATASELAMCLWRGGPAGRGGIPFVRYFQNLAYPGCFSPKLPLIAVYKNQTNTFVCSGRYIKLCFVTSFFVPAAV